MEIPFVSICIPYYNAQKHFPRCLQSICAQKFQNFEIVILDDGSLNPLQIEEPKERICNDNLFIKVIRSINGGTYAARQKAIAESKGEYIFCVDADDVLAGPMVLSEIADALKAFGFPDVLMFNVARENGEEYIDYSGLESRGLVDKKEVVRRFFSDRGWNSMFSFVFRRDLFTFDSRLPRLLMAEDRLQKAEIFAKAATFRLLDKPLYVYRDIAGSKMNSPFIPDDFYDRLYVNHRIGGMLSELCASRSDWAVSSNGYVMASLFDIVRTETLNRDDRVGYYTRFRDEGNCEESLSLLSRENLDSKDYVCLRAFASRHWSELDFLLCVRRELSKIKKTLKRVKGRQ